MNKGLYTILLLIFTFHTTLAQETTGTIQGYIYNSVGTPIEFATIKVVDPATNFVSGSNSGQNGFYQIPNLPPAFYQIEISYIGFQPITENDVKISLSATQQRNFTLFPEDYEFEEIVISEKKLIRDGNGNLLSQEKIAQTPTLFRSIQELTRVLPENNLNSFGGASHRFNNLNIDGVATNDIIGFQEPASGAAGSQANGTPGSLARTQPIGLGAIKELAVKLVPFDASVGNFNGANIDIITKNGTNSFENEVFLYGNNQWTFGKYVHGVEQVKSDFYDYQVGLNSGGPLKRNKVFYFMNIEYANTLTPLTAVPGGVGSTISKNDVTQIRQHLLDQYNYDPGSFEQADIETASTKVFTRLDINLNQNHHLTIRNNFVKSFAENLEWSSNFFNFGNQGFRHNSKANSTVFELKSNYNNVFNKLNIGFNVVEEGRDFDGRMFPHLQIATSSSSRIFAGTYREASVFNTRFKTLQIADKISYMNGAHSWTGGIQLQLNDVDYGFLSAWNGRWEYKSVEDFLNDRPSRIRGVYNVNPERNSADFVRNNPAGTIGVFESAVYFQDKISINNQLELTAGLRLDGQFLTQPLPISPLIQQSENFAHFTNELNHNVQLNPRISFQYKVPNTEIKVHGGTGLFSGKLPYLWFGYMEYISGTDYFNIDIKPQEALPLIEDLGSLQTVQPGLTEVNLLDPAFKFPRDWKSNVGMEWLITPQLSLGAEFSYTNVMQGLLFKTANRNEVFANFDGADQRPYYNTSGAAVKVDPNFTNVFVLGNTNEGYRYNLSFRVDRKSDRLHTSLNYSYGMSKDISSTVRSSPAANYEWNQAIFGNDPNLSYSNYDLRHNIIVSQAIMLTKADFSTPMVLSLLFNSRSGSPFSFVYQGDLNKDGSSRNDLIYVPANSSEIQFKAIANTDGEVISAEEQWSKLEQFIKSNNYLDQRRGQYVERNAAKTPWNHQLDLKLEVKRKIFDKRIVTLSLDVFNVLNLINPNWGRLFFVPNVVNSSFSVLKFEGVEQNIPQYSFNLPEHQEPWIVDPLNSRWKMQLGVKLKF